MRHLWRQDPDRSFQNEVSCGSRQLADVSAGSARRLLIQHPMTCGNAWPHCCLHVRLGGTGIPGGCRADNRAALRGIVHVLRKSASRREVPAEQVGCNGVTAWRRPRDRTEAGLRPQLHKVLPAELRAAGLLDMNDARSTALMSGPSKGRSRRPSPAGRTRPGSRHHLNVDRHGAPLDQLPDQRRPSRHHPGRLPLPDAIPHIPGTLGPAETPAGPPVRRPRPRLRQVPPPSPAPRASIRRSPARHSPRLRIRYEI